MKPLDLHVKHEARVQLHALMFFNDRAKLPLLFQLDRVELLDGHLIKPVLESFELVKICQETGADLAFDQSAQLGVAKTQPAPGGNAVGLVLEALGVIAIPVLEQVVFENLGVNPRHTVDRRGDIHREICHMRLMVLDKEKPAVRMFLFESGVDFLNDVADLRHHRAQQLQIPLFQRLAHDGVVRVREHARGNLECGLKVHALKLQQANQLRNCHCRMRVVELHGVKFRKPVIIAAVILAEASQNVLQRRAGEHILLLDAQLLSLQRRIVRIQNARDVLGFVLRFQRLGVVLRVERIKVQFLLRLALPEPQRTDRVVFKADNRHIIRNRNDRLVGKIDLHRQLVAPVAPRVSELCPVVGVLALAAVFKALLEKPEPVAKSVARQRHIAGCRAVEEARCEPPQTAVAERRVLNLFQARKVHALFRKRLFDLAQNAEVKQVAVNQPSDQILRRKIKRTPPGSLPLFRLDPIVVDMHHDNLAQTFMQPLRRCFLQRFLIAQTQKRLGLLYNLFYFVAHTHSPNCGPKTGFKTCSPRCLADSAGCD